MYHPAFDAPDPGFVRRKSAEPISAETIEEELDEATLRGWEIAKDAYGTSKRIWVKRTSGEYTPAYVVMVPEKKDAKDSAIEVSWLEDGKTMRKKVDLHLVAQQQEAKETPPPELSALDVARVMNDLLDATERRHERVHVLLPMELDYDGEIFGNERPRCVHGAFINDGELVYDGEVEFTKGGRTFKRSYEDLYEDQIEASRKFWRGLRQGYSPTAERELHMQREAEKRAKWSLAEARERLAHEKEKGYGERKIIDGVTISVVYIPREDSYEIGIGTEHDIVEFVGQINSGQGLNRAEAENVFAYTEGLVNLGVRSQELYDQVKAYINQAD